MPIQQDAPVKDSARVLERLALKTLMFAACTMGIAIAVPFVIHSSPRLGIGLVLLVMVPLVFFLESRATLVRCRRAWCTTKQEMRQWSVWRIGIDTILYAITGEALPWLSVALLFFIFLLLLNMI